MKQFNLIIYKTSCGVLYNEIYNRDHSQTYVRLEQAQEILKEYENLVDKYEKLSKDVNC